MRAFLPFFAILVAGCVIESSDKDSDTDGGGCEPITFYTDADGDGFGGDDSAVEDCEVPDWGVTEGGDCNDDDPDVKPGAPELCDETDRDCDGDPYVGATDFATYWADADLDGYGAEGGTETEACTLPADHADNDSDCDDANKDVHPGASEECNGVDDDCDPSTDEDESTDATTWYRDADEDGYGSAQKTACDNPGGYALEGGDCDDANNTIHPFAAELCNGVDDDCDATTEEVEETWYRDDDGDGYGVASKEACEKPNGYAKKSGDCDDDNEAVHPGAVEICNDGVDDDCDATTVEEEETWYRDDDGDGYGDTSKDACEQPNGYAEFGGDCHDDPDVDLGGVAAEDIHPGADEVCNNDVDDDCDSSTDEDELVGTAWYVDADGDGYGYGDATPSCDQPDGKVDNDDDCYDDPNVDLGGVKAKDIHPGAEEVCNDDVDDDCSSATLEDDIVTNDTFYEDWDTDGHGNPDVHMTACDAPTGYVASSDDCDDEDITRTPGKDEICDNTVDEDCDWNLDNGCPVSHCGTISDDETWEALYDHLVTCDVYVYGSTRPMLTIEDGTHVRFASNTSLYVGTYDYGSLNVQGETAGVVFTSDEEVPEPGDWGHVRLGYYDDGSYLLGLTVEYGGGAGSGALSIGTTGEVDVVASTVQLSLSTGLYIDYGAGAAISDSTIAYNGGDGVHVTSSYGLSSSGTPTFTGNDIHDNEGYPMVLDAEFVEQLDASSSFDGNDDDQIWVRGDTIDEDMTWQKLDVPYTIAGTVYVYGASRPVLEIEDGSTFLMQSDSSIEIGTYNWGSLSIFGATEGVTFTSWREAGKKPGDWKGITLGYYDDGSYLEGVTVAYAGANGYGNLFLSYSAPTLVDCTFSNSTTHGMYVDTSASPEVTGSHFEDNDNDGVYVTSNGGLHDGVSPSFADNVLTGNGDAPIQLPALAVGQLASSSQFIGNDDDAIIVTAGTVTDSQTWAKHDVPYRIVEDVYVHDDTEPVLTIEGGSTFYMASDVDVYVGYYDSGSLEVQGGTDPVTFTSAQMFPDRGDWNGLYFGYYDEGSNVVGAHVQYAGGNGYGNVYVSYASVDFSGCTFDESTTNGLYVDTSGEVDVSGSWFTNNDDSGLYVTQNGSLAHGSGPTFTDNTLSGNGDYPVVLPAASAGELDASSSYGVFESDAIHVLGGVIPTDATWQDLGVPYHIATHVYVYDASAPKLTIEAGTTLTFASDAGLLIGYYDDGSLSAVGTPTDPITFTTDDDTPSNGDWSGLQISYYCQTSTIDYATISYGGSNGFANLYLYYCSDVTVDHLTSTYSSTWGLYSYYSSGASIGTVDYGNDTNTAGTYYSIP